MSQRTPATGLPTVDFHNHLMPGADDGARDAREASTGLAALRASGIGDVIATVHVDASLCYRLADWPARMEAIDAAWEELRALAASQFPALRLYRGAEVKLDTPHPDLSDARLRLAGGRFVLVEFPGLQVPVFGTSLIAQVSAAGWVPVLAHPERYRGSRDLVEDARNWVTAGAVLQLNHGSLNGRFGPDVRAAAIALLEARLVSYVASDYHARHRTWIEETSDVIRAEPGGDEVLETLEENGRRLMRDERPLAVPPLRIRGGLLERLKGLFGG